MLEKVNLFQGLNFKFFKVRGIRVVLGKVDFDEFLSEGVF